MQIKKYNKSYEEQVKNIFTLYWTDVEFLDELSTALNSSSCNFYIAQENNEITGVVGVRKADNFLKDHVSTDNPAELYVIASKYKGKGIGSILSNYIIEEYSKMNYTEMICYSPETHNDSWKFYENSGFAKHGIVNDPDDGYPGMLWSKIL